RCRRDAGAPTATRACSDRLLVLSRLSYLRRHTQAAHFLANLRKRLASSILPGRECASLIFSAGLYPIDIACVRVNHDIGELFLPSILVPQRPIQYAI